MCCLFAVMALIGPRVAAFFWWLFDTDRWSATFDSFWVGLIGFLFVPWLTLAWVLVAPDGVRGFDYVVIALAVLGDLMSYSGGGYSNRRRYATV
ncbi:MAG: hypothetical protein R2823_02700 [Acidimicrobiia bacterium]